MVVALKEFSANDGKQPGKTWRLEEDEEGEGRAGSMFSSVSWSWVSGPSVAAQSAHLVGGAPAKIWGSPSGLANLVLVAFWGGPANGIPAFCIEEEEEEDAEGGKRVESGEGKEAQVTSTP
ncbi:hypothetical protein MAJ_00064, partial [Metarhizium majus ARSEF 297]